MSQKSIVRNVRSKANELTDSLSDACGGVVLNSLALYSNPSTSNGGVFSVKVRNEVRNENQIPLNFLSATPMNPTPNYRLAEIFPKKNRTLKKRWYILFYASNPDNGKLQASKQIIVPDFSTAKERTEWANERVKAINKALAQGYTFASNQETAKPNTLTVHSKIIDIIREGAKIVSNEHKSEIIKLAENGLSQKKRKTNSTYSSTCNTFEAYLVEAEIINVSLHDFMYHNGKIIYTEVYKFRDYLVGVRNNSNRTANNVIAHLRGLLNHANRRIGIEDNVFSKIKKLKAGIGRNVAFSEHERKLIIDKVRETDKELYLYILFMYYCMFRKDEVRFLRVQDIQSDSIYINELISKNTKGEFVTIPQHFNKILNELKIRDKPQNAFVFHQEKSSLRPRAINYFYNKHVKILKELKINKDCTMHSWRHTAVVSAHKAGIEIGFIQNQLRHKSLETTVIYLKSLGLSISKEIRDKFPEI
jgi:integrase